MKIALFGKRVHDEYLQYFILMLEKLKEKDSLIMIYENLADVLRNKIESVSTLKTFNTYQDLKGNADFLFSFGGDGTLLDTITLVRNSGIPVMGINVGRLGFLASINKSQIGQAIEQLFDGRFTIDKRSLLKVETNAHCFGETNFALNELTLHKMDPFSMITLDVFVNGVFLNSYWGDGLIVATPTGSTAYSMSTGGPILSPDSNNFIINPISTHNLTVRPMVIPDHSEIRIILKEKNKNFIISIDSRYEKVNSSIEVLVRKEDFQIGLVKMEGESFFKTIRDKLMWGLDIRN